MAITLDALPDEVIHLILTHLTPTTTVALQRTSKRFVNISNEPLLWKSYCQTSFRWWDRQWHFHQNSSDPSFVDWKVLFGSRYRSNLHTRRHLDKIVTNGIGRLREIQNILSTGYDAKDALLDLFWNCSSSPNHLAQRYDCHPWHHPHLPDQNRYWSHAVLGCLHRLIAVEEWLAIKQACMPHVQESSLPYERPLAALDLFVLEDRRDGDLDDVSETPRQNRRIMELTLIDIRSPKFLR